MTERTCWCGTPIGPKEMQCACCRGTPDCEHRRTRIRQNGDAHVAKLIGDPLAAAARELGNGRTYSPAEADVLEATRQQELINALNYDGWKVRRMGQKNAKGTQDPGAPDFYATKPNVGALWVEVKRPHGGILSRAQIEFREDCAAAGVAYVCASQVSDLAPWLYHTADANSRGR